VPFSGGTATHTPTYRTRYGYGFAVPTTRLRRARFPPARRLFITAFVGGLNALRFTPHLLPLLVYYTSSVTLGSYPFTLVWITALWLRFSHTHSLLLTTFNTIVLLFPLMIVTTLFRYLSWQK